jgi:hypothetical protein
MVAFFVVGCRQQFFRVPSLATTGVDFDGFFAVLLELALD